MGYDRDNEWNGSRAGAGGGASTPSGGNTGGDGGHGGWWGSTGYVGYDGTNGSTGAGGWSAGKSITGTAFLTAGSKQGNLSGGTT